MWRVGVGRGVWGWGGACGGGVGSGACGSGVGGGVGSVGGV